MKPMTFLRFLVLALALPASGCYMNLNAVDSDILTRLDAIDQRLATLEQGRPAVTSAPESDSSKDGRVNTANFTEAAPDSRPQAAAGSKPAGRIRLKERSSRTTPPKVVAPPSSDE
ncbi:MAG TPA: hypothetical protein VKU82_15610 [Planctomycetaceae bacterium]|nr:hypothetical protein [Planctomycetaceae bacterium]